jgi:hypothetical protein
MVHRAHRRPSRSRRMNPSTTGDTLIDIGLIALGVVVFTPLVIGAVGFLGGTLGAVALANKSTDQ